MAPDSLTTVNVYALFRFALSYPDERHLELFRRSLSNTPATLEELRSLYITLFEAGLPHPRCPLLESFYVANRPSTEVVLENKLFYKHFDLNVQSKAAPDHLLTQLEFLSWLEHLLAAGHPDPESVVAARSDFLARHVSHWIARAASLVRDAGGGCYVDLFEFLVGELEASPGSAAGMDRSVLHRS